MSQVWVAQYPWHAPVLDAVSERLSQNRLPHALSLRAVPGWGVEQLLRDLCEGLLETKISHPITEFAHPDFRWVEPEKAELKIDQIRRVNEFAVQTPQIAPRKVVAISQAETLNESAANALLKILEEPPPNTHFLLATEQWGKLLPTIRSRTQQLRVDPDMKLAHTWLAEQGVVGSEHDAGVFGWAPLTARGVLGVSDGKAQASPIPPQPVLSGGVFQLESHLTFTWFAGAEDSVAALELWYRAILSALKHHPHWLADRQWIVRLHDFCEQVLSAKRQIETRNSANAKMLVDALEFPWSQLVQGCPKVD